MRHRLRDARHRDRGSTIVRPSTARLAGAAAIAVALGVSWLAGSGPGQASLDANKRAVLDAVEDRDHMTDSATAAEFVAGNLDVLLSADFARAVDHDDTIDLFDLALSDGHAAQALLGQVTERMAHDGEIHIDGLREVFVDAVIANMDWLDQRVNAPFTYSPAGIPARVTTAYLSLHDFLRETLRDSECADRLRAALDGYGMVETAAAPETGEPRDRRLVELGRLQTFLFEAHRNAERGRDFDEDDPEQIAAAHASEQPRIIEDAVNRAVWLALDVYEADTTEGAALRSSAQGRAFVDETGRLKASMSMEEEAEFRHWAASLMVDGGPLDADDRSFGAGSTDIVNSIPTIRGRW